MPHEPPTYPARPPMYGANYEHPLEPWIHAAGLFALLALLAFLPLCLALGCQTATPAWPPLPVGARILIPQADRDIPNGTEVFSFGTGQHYVEWKETPTP